MPGPPRGLEKPGQRVRQVSDEVRTTTRGPYDLTFRGEGSCSWFLGLKPGVKGASGQMAVAAAAATGVVVVLVGAVVTTKSTMLQLQSLETQHPSDEI